MDPFSWSTFLEWLQLIGLLIGLGLMIFCTIKIKKWLNEHKGNWRFMIGLILVFGAGFIEFIHWYEWAWIGVLLTVAVMLAGLCLIFWYLAEVF